MRFSRNLLAVGLGAGLLAAAGVAVAQEPATRMVKVPANAVVLVLPPGAQVLQPGQVALPAPAAFPTGPGGMGVASPIEAMFQRMDAEMNAMMAAAAHGAGMATAGGPAGVLQAMMRDMPPGGSSVVVTSFADGSHQCTQRVVYDGNAAPIVQTSGDACGAMGHATTPTAAPEYAPAHARAPRLIEASAPRAALRLADAAD